MLIENLLNECSLVFPILECLHLAGIVCGVGTIALVNLRLLGVGLTRNSAAQVWRDTMPWTLGGLTLAIFSGLLLFSVDPDVYYLNRAFLAKMLFLALALVFYYTAVRSAARSGAVGWITPCVSLGLWAMVPFGGIFIGFANATGSTYFYPIVLSLHIVALVFFGGMVIATDLRLLGIGMRHDSLEELVNKLRLPKRIGFIVVVSCGALLCGLNPQQYSYNRWFWIKLALLALVPVNYLIFRRTVYANTAELDRAPKYPFNAKLAGGLSLLLWTGVICAAREPATIKDIMHSMVDPSGDFLFKSVQIIADDRGVREKAPKTDAEWQDVRARVLVLMEAPSILIKDGRLAARPKDRSKDPEVENQPEEIQRLLDADRTGFLRRARRLHDAAAVALMAVDAKDKDALLRSLDGIDKACESCHLHYWYPRDKRAQEAAKTDGITD